MRRVKTLLLIFALSGKLLFCPGAFAQVDVENLGDDRPADIDIEEDFVPATHSQWLAFALKNLQNNHSNMACSALKLNYYHGFADDERITGSSAPFGNVTSDGYKASTSTPIASQNYIMGTKSYWKPVSVGFMDKQSFIRVRLEQRQNNSPIPISPEEEEEIRQLAAIDYYRERGYCRLDEVDSCTI